MKKQITFVVIIQITRFVVWEASKRETFYKHRYEESTKPIRRTKIKLQEKLGIIDAIGLCILYVQRTFNYIGYKTITKKKERKSEDQVS